jgi:dTDP-4-dehydrorhamnose 3,5-epimerase-like enzyme
MVKLVLIDTREGSPTNGAVNEFFLGTHNPTLVQVPNLGLPRAGSASAWSHRSW